MRCSKNNILVFSLVMKMEKDYARLLLTKLDLNGPGSFISTRN
jgi:hypothetical protein